jgi:hypothetical protein
MPWSGFDPSVSCTSEVPRTAGVWTWRYMDQDSNQGWMALVIQTARLLLTLCCYEGKVVEGSNRPQSKVGGSLPLATGRKGNLKETPKRPLTAR